MWCIWISAVLLSSRPSLLSNRASAEAVHCYFFEKKKERESTYISLQCAGTSFKHAALPDAWESQQPQVHCLPVRCWQKGTFLRECTSSAQTIWNIWKGSSFQNCTDDYEYLNAILAVTKLTTQKYIISIRDSLCLSNPFYSSTNPPQQLFNIFL